MAGFILDDLKNVFRASGNAVMQLVLINAVVFFAVGIADAIIGPVAIEPYWPASHLGAPGFPAYLQWVFSVKADVVHFWYHIWGLFTYMFIHAGFRHIFFNMLIFFFMGRVVQDFVGAKRLWALYIMGGLAGSVLYLVSYNLFHLLFPGNVIWEPASYLLGASASVMAIVAAAAMLSPDLEIRLFFVLPVKLKYVAIGLVVLTSLTEFTDNTGGKIAHLGGAFMGYFFIRAYQNGRDLSRWLDPITAFFTRRSGQRQGKMSVAHGPRHMHKSDAAYVERKTHDQRKMDEILDKINKSGYPSLSAAEKEFLAGLSNNKK